MASRAGLFVSRDRAESKTLRQVIVLMRDQSQSSHDQPRWTLEDAISDIADHDRGLLDRLGDVPSFRGPDEDSPLSDR